ncbi:MAG: hypothetical protein L3J46_11775 [Kangiellaceae bacterium]|nr:hypothetical protein [Kangiellaceae bacterium]
MSVKHITAQIAAKLTTLSKRINPSYLSLALLFAAGIFTALLALPTDDEYVTMLIRDDYNERALVRLEDMYRNGGRKPYNVKKMIELYIRYGREKEVIPIISSYLKKSPNDEAINDFQLWLYELNGKKKRYLEYLETLTDRTLSKKYMDKLNSTL